jgi:hypothetical protein
LKRFYLMPNKKHLHALCTFFMQFIGQLWKPFCTGCSLLAIMFFMVISCIPLGTVVCPAAMAQGNPSGFSPQVYNNGAQYGTGVFFAPPSLALYKTANDPDAPQGVLQWSQNDTTVSLAYANGHTTRIRSDLPFFCFYPEMQVAMMAVVGTSEDGEWADVVYDQKTGKTAWVKLRLNNPTSQTGKATTADPAFLGVYQTWVEFMRLNARQVGVYWLSGIQQYQRSLRMSDSDDATLLPVTVMRKIQVRHVRGNWLLVEVSDLQGDHPIGWVRWRGDDGQLLAFPNLSGKHLPMVMTGF